MRSLLPACALLLLLMLGANENSRYMDRCTASLLPPLQQAREYALSHRWEAGCRALDRFQRSWQSRQRYLQITTEHSELDRAEDLLASLREFMAQGELPECLSQLAQLEHQIRLLARLQQLTLGNIL